jgi:hypothetical protein
MPHLQDGNHVHTDLITWAKDHPQLLVWEGERFVKESE